MPRQVQLVVGAQPQRFPVPISPDLLTKTRNAAPARALRDLAVEAVYVAARGGSYIVLEREKSINFQQALQRAELWDLYSRWL